MGGAVDRLLELARFDVRSYVRRIKGKAVPVVQHQRKGLPGMRGMPAKPAPQIPAKKGKGKPGATRENPLRTGDVVEAARALTEGKFVELTQPRQVCTLLDKLAEMVDDAMSKGDKAPNYDLCKVSIKGTNLFCIESKGIARVKMPQLAGEPKSGSKADKLPKDKDGRVDLSPQFRNFLQDKGVEIVDSREPAAFLRATQAELNGGKVAQIARVVEKGGSTAEPRIFVSRDNYIVDGHHRWAALVGLDAKDGRLGNEREVDVARIDLSITQLLRAANTFSDEWGIPQMSAADIGGPASKLGPRASPAQPTREANNKAAQKSSMTGGAVDHLVVTLGRQWIKPYVRVREGKREMVEGYLRDFPWDLTPSSWGRTLAPRGGGMRAMPAKGAWKVCEECAKEGHVRDFENWFERAGHFKKHHPGIPPKLAPDAAPSAVTVLKVKAEKKESALPSPVGSSGKPRNVKSMSDVKLQNEIEALEGASADELDAARAEFLTKLKTEQASRSGVAPPEVVVMKDVAEAKEKTEEVGKVIPFKPGQHSSVITTTETLDELRAKAKKHGIAVGPLWSRVDIMDALREKFGTFDPDKEVDPAKAQSLDNRIDWTAKDPFASIEKEFLNEKWIAEPKLDGLRMRVFLGAKANTMNTGRRSKVTYSYPERADRFPHFRDAVVPEEAGTVLDAEIMPPVDSVVTQSGVKTQGTLNTIQAMTNVNPKDAIATQQKYGKAVLVVFDITSRRGEDITGLSFTERRKHLEEVMQHLVVKEPAFQIIYQMEAKAPNIQAALDHGFEGVILKRKDAKYFPGKRMASWQKIKRLSTGDFYIIGSIPGKGSNAGKVGSLKVAYRGPKGEDVYVADVAGFDEKTRELVTDPETGGVKEEFLGRVIEVAAQARTKNNRLRHPRFIRWRIDKKAEDTDEAQLLQNFTQA